MAGIVSPKPIVMESAWGRVFVFGIAAPTGSNAFMPTSQSEIGVRETTILPTIISGQTHPYCLAVKRSHIKTDTGPVFPAIMAKNLPT